MTVFTDEPPPPQLLPPLGTRLSPARAELLHRFPAFPLDTTLGEATSMYTRSQSGQVGAHAPPWGPGSLALPPPTVTPESSLGPPAPQTSQHGVSFTGAVSFPEKTGAASMWVPCQTPPQPPVTPAQPQGPATAEAGRAAHAGWPDPRRRDHVSHTRKLLLRRKLSLRNKRDSVSRRKRKPEEKPSVSPPQ